MCWLQNVHQLPDYDKVSFPPMRPLDPSVYMAAALPCARDFVLQLVSLSPSSRLTASQVLSYNASCHICCCFI